MKQIKLNSKYSGLLMDSRIGKYTYTQLKEEEV